MDSHNIDSPTDGISNYISKRTGHVTEQHPHVLPVDVNQDAAFDRGLENLLSEMHAPAVHCFINKRTGERTSMSTNVHGYGGGFAVTRREERMPQTDVDGTQLFEQTSMTSLPHGVRHVFSLARPYPNANFISSSNTDSLATVDNPRDLLHQGDSQQLQNVASTVPQLPTIAQEYRRNSRNSKQRLKGREPKMSEDQLFASAVKLHARRTGFLSQSTDSNPYIRSHHLVTNNRTLAYTSVFLSLARGPKAILSVFWETKKKPHCAITINLSIPQGSDSIIANCSCDYLITQTKNSQPNCSHAQVLLHDEGFIQQVTGEIRRGQEVSNLDNGSSIFANPLDISSISETSPHLTTFLERHTSKKRVLAQPWMFFVVFDTRLQLFMPLVKVLGKGMQCMGCRLSPVMGGNCSHVEACLSACQALHIARRSSGLGFLTDIGININRDEAESDSDRTLVLDEEVNESDSDDDVNPGHNQSVQQREIFYPTTFTRRVLPCPGELGYMREIARRIDQVPPGEYLALDDRETVSCHKCGSLNAKPRYQGYRREVVLFTLAQGTPKVNVYDWYCDICNEKRLFTGKTLGVFPARKKICYTTELMYILLEMTCTNALSFRTAYRITRLFERTQQVSMRGLGKKVETIDPGDERKRSRRRTNEAFRAFVMHLDTSSSSITGTLFSCDTCEVPLSVQDCEELEIDPEAASGLKRLQAIVVDGTAAGILTKLPDYDRHTAVVPPAEGGMGSVCIIVKAKHRKILTKFLDIWRSHLRKWKLIDNGRASKNPEDSHNLIGYPNLVFWICNPSKASLQGVLCDTSLLNENESHITQLYINNRTCFCPFQERQGQYRHMDKCRDIRATFSKAKIASEIHDIFKQLFVVSQYATPERDQPTQAQHQTHARSSTNSDSDADDDVGYNEELYPPGRISGAYMRLLLSDLKENTQFIECTISTLQFLLLEHVAMPYVGRLFVRPTQSNNRNDEQHGNAQASHQADEVPVEQHVQDQRHEQDMSDVQDVQDVQDMQDVKDVQDVQDVQDVRAEQHMREELDERHDQYTLGGTQERQRRDTNHDNDNEENSDAIRNQETRERSQEQDQLGGNMMSFTSGSIEFHKRFIEAMDNYMNCLHFQEEGRIQNVPQECRCVRNLKEATVNINELNPVLGAFAREFLKLKRPLHIPESCFGNALLDLLRYHMKEAQNFFITLRNSLPEECEQYWMNFASTKKETISNILQQQNQVLREQAGSTDQEHHSNSEIGPNISSSQHHEDVTMNSVTPITEVEVTGEPVSVEDLATAEVQEAQETGLCFPGRRSVRPSIIFRSQDKQNCSKQYKTSKSHSPGLLTVQCACDSPKLIGFVVMTQAESTALALSSILTHFRVPPRAVFL